MRTRFESIQDQLQQSEQFHGTLSQMWAQLQLIKESGRKYGSVDGVYEWDSVSSSHVEEITKVQYHKKRPSMMTDTYPPLPVFFRFSTNNNVAFNTP
jgi:nuclear pore complex protein Nup54